MHAPPFHQTRGTLWLVAGTGEGPPLAELLLRAGWRVHVSVVTAAAARAYAPHPALELTVGSIGGDTSDDGLEARALNGVLAELARAAATSGTYRWVIDATHPFASRISAALAQGCACAGVRLLRLERPALAGGQVRLLADLDALGALGRQEAPPERLLLAIGARRLAEAVPLLQRGVPKAILHARILPHAGALQQALAAGLAPERLACLRPSGEAEAEAAIERALCRRWGIDTVLCRSSGGPTEAHWRRIAGELGLTLLLLERPAEPCGGESLPLAKLLQRLEAEVMPASECLPKDQ
jgi:precorrin-6A/cobalt-precorrin-6A reductase